jgi:hypothetical protein
MHVNISELPSQWAVRRDSSMAVPMFLTLAGTVGHVFREEEIWVGDCDPDGRNTFKRKECRE